MRGRATLALLLMSSAAHAAGALLPEGYLSTRGNQIVDAGDCPVRIASIGWPGTDGPAGSALHGLWTVSYKTVLEAIKGAGLNTVRLPYSDVSLDAVPANTPALGTIDFTRNPDLRGLSTLGIFQKIVAYAKQIGLKVIFDHHTNDGGGGQQRNGLWFDSGPGSNGTDGAGHTGTVTAAKFEQNWARLAKTFANDPTVIGFDLDNEPTSAGHVTWGDGGPTDIHAMATRVGNALLAADPGALIIVGGPQNYHGSFAGAGIAPEGDLTLVGTKPVVLNMPNKVVYSVHEYPSEIAATQSDSGPAYVRQMNRAWGYVVAENLAPVWIGEMGSSMRTERARAWAKTLLDYMNGKDGAQGGPAFAKGQQPVGGSWWLIGQEHDQPDGLQTAWGLGHYRPEQQAIIEQMVFDREQGSRPCLADPTRVLRRPPSQTARNQ